ncbi:thioesterase II family protein [Xenorhabdus griffiniae]|uniref:Alpha/beta fold hydrolase n=1 Tax=Xenorhabdus griffiniae TaxID=351672 RepID=A0ABY9XIW9_9GAMM|nr:alpha/beta fold hydrolase [Xenorhabdus griffiniae]WMV72858.1 alpha/beta fold hydrolase [Xenorhabdus griffiniae]WNH02537.1 alpha/beta fold hydrolase [Xenorhabdus griffiniae]
MMNLIFCLPHAGGGAHHYLGWSAHIDSNIEWIPLDYAGHFSRMNEPVYSTFEQAAHDLANDIIIRADGRPFALFGHSMGGALAYEIACLMSEQQFTENLRCIIVSSTLPAHSRNPNMPRYYELSDLDFIQHLVETGGMTSQLAKQTTLMETYLPLIRQDYRLYHQYQPAIRLPLTLPLYTLWGEQEEERNQRMQDWANYSYAFAGSKTYPGDHFYWYHCLSEVATDISAIVRQSGSHQINKCQE